MHHKTSFTIVELLFVILILSFLLPTIFLVYNQIQKTKLEIDIRQQLVQQTYEFLERMNVLMQDYTIDYEEYFNRKMVGCVSGKKGTTFTRDVGGSGHCTEFTAYGNGNSAYSSLTGAHILYYLSSLSSDTPGGGTSASVIDYVMTPKVIKTTQGFSLPGPYQSFGQYSKLFYDVKNDTDGDSSLVNDSDDEDLGVGPVAIAHATGVQELYLISPDGTRRLYFRRKLIATEDITGDGIIGTGESLYVPQILRLRGFDAGVNHDFGDIDADNNPGVYDGQIDTWACDAEEGFIGRGASVGGAYTGYRLPVDADDCWVDMYQGAISVEARNLTLSPDTDPISSRKGGSYQVNPYVSIFLLHKVYYPQWKNKVRDYSSELQVAVETAFNTNTFYTQ